MTLRKLTLSSIAVLFLLGLAGPIAAACEPDGDVQFLCGPVSPEDLVAIPQSPWIIVSSMEDEGHLYLADSRNYTTTMAFPTATSSPRHDASTYGSCPGQETSRFRPHGLTQNQTAQYATVRLPDPRSTEGVEETTNSGNASPRSFPF